MESPRLWSFENRLKLLGIVLLVYAFLLYLLEDVYKELVEALLRFKCHRTGKRCREALVPLYRLRWALSRLWDDTHPVLGSYLPPDLETLQILAPFRWWKRSSKIRDDSYLFFVVVRVDCVHTHHHKKLCGAASPRHSGFEDF